MTDTSKDSRKLDSAKRWFLVVWTIIGVGVVIVGLSYALNILSVPMGVLIWTVIIVFCLRGIVSSLERRNVNRALATTIAYAIMIAVILLIVVLMVTPTFGLSTQFSDLIASIPSYIEQVRDWLNGIYEQYADVLNNDTVRQWLNQAASSLVSAAQDMAKSSATSVVNVGASAANLVMVIGFALVIAFWILMELPGIGRECNRLIAGGKHEEDWRMLHFTLTRVMGGYIKATLLQCAVIAVCCGVLFAILGVPNFAAVALITGVLNIIPVVGPWLGGGVAAILALFASPLTAIVAFIGTIAIQQAIYTFVSPKFMQNSVDIHPALTLICLLVGSALGGAMSGLAGSVVGMLISIPATAVLKSVFVYYFEKNTGRQLVAEDGVFFQGTPSEGDDIDPMGDAVSPHPGNTEKFHKIGPTAFEAQADKERRREAVEEQKAQDARSREARRDDLRTRLNGLRLPNDEGTHAQGDDSDSAGGVADKHDADRNGADEK